MANNIKGITVEIGGNTGPLTSALKDVNKAANGTQSELKEVNRQLKFDPKNTTLLKQKIDLLKSSVQELTQKQVTLKEAVQQAHEQFDKGDLGADKVRAVEREYEKTTSQLKSTKQELTAVEKTSGTVGERIKATFQTMGQSIKEHFGSALRAASAGIATAFGAVASKGVALASDLTEVQNVVETTFEKNTAAVNAWAEKSGESFGVSQLDAEKYASTIGAMLKSMGLGSQNVMAMSEKITALSGDMASFYNLDSAEAFEKIRSGIAGETEPLKQLGINMSEANLSAFAMSQGIKTAYSKMSQAQQTTLRYNYLLSVTKDAQGDYAKTATSAANQQRTLKMEIEDMSEKIGTALLPTVQKILALILKVVQPISKFIAEHPKLTAAILVIVGVLASLIGGLSAIISVLALFNVHLKVSEILLTGGIMLAVMALIAIVAVVITHWKPITAFFVDLWKSVSGAFVSAWNGIKSFFVGLWGWMSSFFAKWGPLILTFLVPFIGIPLLIKQHWSQITSFFAGLWSWLTGFFAKWGPLILSIIAPFIGLPLLIKQHWSQISSFFAGLWSGVMGTARNAWGNFVSFIRGIPGRVLSGLSGLGGAVRSAFDGAINFIKGLPGQALQWGKDIIDGIVNGIKSAADHVKQAVGNVAQSIRSFLHFSEPDTGPLKGFHGWWRDMMYGMADDINANLSPVRDAVSRVASTVAGNVGGQAGALLAGSTSSLMQTTNNATTSKTIVEQHFYGDIRADSSVNKSSSLQQLQFLSQIG